MSNRIVYASHGHDKLMGYKFQARIEEKSGRYGFLWMSKGTVYRYVIERYFMAWVDSHHGYWTPDKEFAIKCANDQLDRIESPIKHKSEYI